MRGSSGPGRGLATAAATGARFCDGELHRIQAELLRLGSPDDAVAAVTRDGGRSPEA